MRRAARALHPLLGLILGVAVVGVAWAASYRVTPVSARYTGPAPGGINTHNVIEMVRDGNGTYVQKSVTVSNNTLGNLAKGVLKRANTAATAYWVAKSVIDGMGWAIDELQQQVVTPGTGESKAAGSTMWCLANLAPLTQVHCSSSASGTMAICNAYFSPCSVREETGSYIQLRRQPGPGYGDTMQFNKVTISTMTPDWANGNPSNQPVAVEAVGQAMANSPQAAQALLLDANGNPVLTPELVQALNDVRKAAETLNGDDPGPDIEVDPNFPDAPPRENVETNIPAFCDWARVVCDWINWTKEEPEYDKPDVPWEELPLESQQWTSGLPSNGTCPAPVVETVTLGNFAQQVEFSYQPVCDALSLLRYVVIAIGIVIAGQIIAGLRSSPSV